MLEIILQLSIGILFVLMVKRGLLFGRLFAFYLVAYGLFRFLTEFIRETPKFFGGISGYQILSLMMISVGLAFLLKRTLAPPPAWNKFRESTTDPQPARADLEASHV
jgi:prolipoprotein diacylglyceryltransferase